VTTADREPRDRVTYRAVDTQKHSLGLNALCPFPHNGHLEQEVGQTAPANVYARECRVMEGYVAWFWAVQQFPCFMYTCLTIVVVKLRSSK
jgi:hypothetical protein